MAFQTLKGFRDILPDEMLARKEIIAKTENLVKKYGFVPLETPALESADLLLGKYGNEEKLIYKFRDPGLRDIALRYDLTASLARVIANYKGQITFPFKRYQYEKVWRAEKPQKGRFREFSTFDIDIVGSSSTLADAEIIVIMSEWLESFGLEYEIKVNDRRIFNTLMVKIKATSQESKAISILIDKADKMGFEESKKGIQEITKNPIMLDYLKIKNDDFATVEKLIDDAKVTQNLKEIIRQAQKMGTKNIVFDPKIIRGLDYYTGTVFEAVALDYRNFGSVAGGGRYDEMISKLANGDYPTVGIGFGIDRIFEVLKTAGKIELAKKNTQVAILNIEEKLLSDYLVIAKKLREKNIACELFYQTEKLSKQLSKASKQKIPYVLIYGSQEKSKNLFVLRDMQKSEQKEFKNLDQIVKYWHR